MESCIYEGTIRHRRTAPREHSFRYRLFMMYLDLDELDQVLRGRLLWSHRHPAVAWFRRADYLGDPRVPLKDAVRALVRQRVGEVASGPVRLLTHFRYFGFCFNPVSFYFLFDEGGRRLEQIVAEINNTPWNERFCYVLEGAGQGKEPGQRQYRFDKAFHVSPFMGMDQVYQWYFNEPGSTLSIHMENSEQGVKRFDASMVLRRTEISSRSLHRVLLAYPLITLKVLGAIYWNAFHLWRKRIPFYSHPSKSKSENRSS